MVIAFITKAVHKNKIPRYSDPQLWDHIFVQTACTRQIFRPGEEGSHFKWRKGSFAPVRNCFMGKDLAEDYAEYVRQFFDVYSGKKKYMKLSLLDAHEFTGDKGKYLDDIILKMLVHLDNKGHLDKTILFMYSDHGDHLLFLGHQTESGSREKYNPFFLTMIPDYKTAGFVPHILNNRQKISSHFDIFATDFRLLGLPGKLNGMSLLQEDLPDNRECKDIHVQETCICDGTKNKFNF